MNNKTIVLNYSPGECFHFIQENKIKHVVVRSVLVEVHKEKQAIVYKCVSTPNGTYNYNVTQEAEKFEKMEDAKVALAKHILGSSYKIEKVI